jgi:hypothetical protein
LILVSLVGDNTDELSLIDPHLDVFRTKIQENETWGYYEYYMYGKFKAHWCNGVNMFTKYGQHDLANNNCIVCASVYDVDFTRMVRLYKASNPNTIVFDKFLSEDNNPLTSHSPGPIPTAFVSSYTNFMKLVSIWKWIDSHKNEVELLDTDTTFAIMQRTMFQRNIQFREAYWDSDWE